MTQLAYTVRNAAALLDVSESSIREAINKQALRAFRVGRGIRIDHDDLMGWFHGLTVVGSEQDIEERS